MLHPVILTDIAYVHVLSYVGVKVSWCLNVPLSELWASRYISLTLLMLWTPSSTAGIQITVCACVCVCVCIYPVILKLCLPGKTSTMYIKTISVYMWQSVKRGKVMFYIYINKILRRLPRSWLTLPYIHYVLYVNLVNRSWINYVHIDSLLTFL